MIDYQYRCVIECDGLIGGESTELSSFNIVYVCLHCDSTMIALPLSSLKLTRFAAVFYCLSCYSDCCVTLIRQYELS